MVASTAPDPDLNRSTPLERTAADDTARHSLYTADRG